MRRFDSAGGHAMTARYHTRFNNLHDTAVEQVDDAAPDIWNTNDWMAVLEVLADRLAETYGMPAPSVEHGGRELYRSSTETIELPRASLVSFLHEFRHHMQKHGRQANPDIEEDARGWSVSMFAEAEPEYFQRAWEDGRILFMEEA